MKRSEQEKLLKEILPGEDAGGFERASLERGLTGMRQQRRRRQVLRAGALAAMGMVIALGILPKLKRSSSVEVVANSGSMSKPAAETERRVQVISDDELLAMFPGRSVALIGKPGEQRLVFLDESDTAKGQF